MSTFPLISTDIKITKKFIFEMLAIIKNEEKFKLS